MLVALASRLVMRARGEPKSGGRRIMGLHVKGEPKPVYIRLGTSDLWVFREIFLDHEYEPVKAAGLSDARVIVDLGSNIGLSVRYWRTLFPRARIVAVEPDAGNMAVCRKNAEAAGGLETFLVQACVAGSHRKVSLDRSRARRGRSRSRATERRGRPPQAEENRIPMRASALRIRSTRSR